MKMNFVKMEITDNNGMNAGTEERMVLRTEGLVKRYGKRTVVNNVSFDVKQGEIVGLLGPNGAGKTTSFYMTTGLVVPNGGRIFLNDEEITKFPVYKRARAGIGYLAQEASVFRKLSVEDNIASVLELTGKPKEYQKEKLESLIEKYKDIIRRDNEIITRQDKEIKKLKKLLGLYEACINKGVNIDFPNSDLKAEEPSDNIY